MVKSVFGLTFVFAAVVSMFLAGVARAEGEPIQCEFPAADRVVVISTVGGHMNDFRELMRYFNLIDENDDWVGGETNLVQLGNLYGPGEALDEAVHLLMKLEKQAQEAGGAVHVLHGKSEDMLLRGNISRLNVGGASLYRKYASDDAEEKRAQLIEDLMRRFDEFAATPLAQSKIRGDDPDRRERRLAYARSNFERQMEYQVQPGAAEYLEMIGPGTEMGDWLRSRNTVIRIGDVVYSYGGVSMEYAERPLAEINAQFRDEIKDYENLWIGPRIDKQGPLYWGDLSRLREADTREQTEWISYQLGVRAQVVGHSPKAWPVAKHRVYHVDSLLGNTGGAPPAGLEIAGGRFIVHSMGEVVDHGEAPPLPDEAPKRPGVIEIPEE